MARSTRSSLAIGVLLTILGALVIDHGGHFGIQLIHLGEMGLAVGAVLGLVPDRAPGWRAGSFAVGFVAAWLGFALRAGLLPDIPMGHAIATVIVLGLVTAATAASFGRLPLWAGLLGVAAFSRGYETTFSADPSAFDHDSMTDATTIALAVGLGFLGATLVDGIAHLRVKPAPQEVAPTPPPLVTPAVPRPRPRASATTRTTPRGLPVQSDAATSADSAVTTPKTKEVR